VRKGWNFEPSLSIGVIAWTRVYSGAALATSVAAVEAQSNCHRETGRPKPPRLVGGTC